MVKIEVKLGSKGNPIMVVKFVKETNFDPANLTWVPRKDELKLLVSAAKLIIK